MVFAESNKDSDSNNLDNTRDVKVSGVDDLELDTSVQTEDVNN